MTTRILIAHGDGLVLAGVEQALAADDRFESVGEVREAAALVPRVAEKRPDVVLLDVHIPGAGGIECARRLRALHPEVAVVMCSMPVDRELIEQAFQAGASGYILERSSAADLAAAIRQAVVVGARTPPAPAEDVPEWRAGLTPREADVLEAVSRGLSNKAIAAELCVTTRTVKFHLTSIYRKLRVTNRTEAARWALSRGVAL